MKRMDGEWATQTVEECRRLSQSNSAFLLTDEDGQHFRIAYNFYHDCPIKEKTELIEQALSCFKTFRDEWIDKLKNEGLIQ